MKNKFWSLSLQTKLTICILLTSFVVVCISALLLYKAWEYNDRAERIVQISQCTEQFFAAIQEIAFERGRVNVILAGKRPINESERNFIQLQRTLSGEHMDAGFAMLEGIDPVMAADLRKNYATFLKLREKIDDSLALPAAEKEEQIRKDWFQQSTVFIYQFKNILEVLEKKEIDSGFFSRYHQIQLNSMEFRLFSGQSVSILLAAINKETPWTPEEYLEFIELRTKADYLWSKIEIDVRELNNDALTQNTYRVYNAYYEVYRPAQERLLPLVLTGRAPIGSVKELQALSVPALNSVFTLVDAANEETLIYVQAMKHKAALIFRAALLQFFLGLIFVSFTIAYFKMKLFKPLNRISKALTSISAGESVPQLEIEGKRCDEIGQLTHGVKMLQKSMDEERRLKELNEYLAMTDSLTGCLNRRAFYQRAELEIARVTRDHKRIAFAIIDVDNMKYINDTYGHMIGDEMLKYLIKIISDNCRPYDLIGRFGGDEFMLCLQGADDREVQEAISWLHITIQENPLLIKGLEEPLYLSVSMGVIVGGKDKGKSPDWFIGKADIALYQAKEGGKNGIVFLDDVS